MSRIGKKPIDVPAGLEININEKDINIKGALGELKQEIDDSAVKISLEEEKIIIKPLSGSKEARSKYGLYRSLIYNMVTGVSKGFSKTLKIVGVGYRAALKGNNLELQLGYSDPVLFDEVKGITFEVPDNTTIIVKGINKQLVGEVAAQIRAKRKPEPYKGKGIKYEDEFIRRKVGKAAITAAGN